MNTSKIEMKVIRDLQFPTMFWLQWPDGVLSTHFYTKTWVYEHKRRIEKEEILEPYLPQINTN